MYCSGCGQAISEGQAFCPQCGRPVAFVAAPVPGLEFQVENYRSKVRTLAVVWFVYAGLSVLLTIFGIGVAKSVLGNIFGNWTGSAPPPSWLIPAIVHFTLLALVFRTGLALAAGWGLMQRAPWGRIVAIIVAFLNLIHFPLGTALGIWTLIMLMGYRNTALYEQM